MMDEVDKIGHDFRGDPGGGAARGARPGAEQHLRRPLPRDPVRPLERHVRRDGEHRRPDPGAAPRPHGDPRDPRLHAAREAGDRAPAPDPEAARGARHHQGAARHHRQGGRPGHRLLHARGRRPHARAPDRQHHPRRGREDRRGRHDAAQGRRRGPGARVPGPAEVHERGRRAHRGGRRRHRAWPGPASAARSSSSRRPACTARASCSSPVSSATS